MDCRRGRACHRFGSLELEIGLKVYLKSDEVLTVLAIPMEAPKGSTGRREQRGIHGATWTFRHAVLSRLTAMRRNGYLSAFAEAALAD